LHTIENNTARDSSHIQPQSTMQKRRRLGEHVSI
jgi:hypothetical protein